MIYLLTPTGGRPECIQFLARYINNQTYQGDMTWVIVDDCDPATPIPDVRCQVIPVRPDWRWKPGMNTQAESIMAGLRQIDDENARILIMEDDDIYLPNHVANIVQHLETYDLVGEAAAPYYNVSTGKYRKMGTGQHCALASTGLKDEAIDAFIDVLEPGSRFIDSRLWRGFHGHKIQLRTQNVVGVKGMPGREGIGVGHRKSFGKKDIRNEFQALVGSSIASQYVEYRQ